MTTVHERETIDGKPYFGVWMGQFVTLIDNPISQLQNEPKLEIVKNMLLYGARRAVASLGEMRHVQWIIRPPLIEGAFDIPGTVAIKYMFWGRAYKVMRRTNLHKGHRYRKKRVNGLQKWVRVDRKQEC